jgi:hypothetical protein
MITRCPQSLGCRATGKSSSHLRHSPVVSLSRFCSTPSRWACARTRDGHRRRTSDEWRAGPVQTVAATHRLQVQRLPWMVRSGCRYRTELHAQ